MRVALRAPLYSDSTRARTMKACRSKARTMKPQFTEGITIFFWQDGREHEDQRESDKDVLRQIKSIASQNLKHQIEYKWTNEEAQGALQFISFSSATLQSSVPSASNQAIACITAVWKMIVPGIIHEKVQNRNSLKNDDVQWLSIQNDHRNGL